MLSFTGTKRTVAEYQETLASARDLSDKSPVQSATPKNIIPYRDVWPILMGSLFIAHFIEVLGNDESVFELLLTEKYYLEVLSGFVIAIIVFSYISQATRFLDRRFDWNEQPLVRTGLQLALGVGISSLMLYGLVQIQFTYLFEADLLASEWMVYEFRVCLILLGMVNIGYLTYYFYYQARYSQQALAGVELVNQQAEQPVATPVQAPKRKKQIWIITKGHRHIPLAIDEVAYFYLKDEYTYIRTFQNETHLIDESLDEIYSLVDDNTFFRANRQTIIHFRACQYYAPLEHGKLAVSVKPEGEEAIVISQKRAPQFKEWLNK